MLMLVDLPLIVLLRGFPCFHDFSHSASFPYIPNRMIFALIFAGFTMMMMMNFIVLGIQDDTYMYCVYTAQHTSEIEQLRACVYS